MTSSPWNGAGADPRLRRCHPHGEAAEGPRRDVANPDAKRTIARLAASLVKPHQTLIFDVGTTVAEAARALPHDLAGQVLTNSLFTAQELSRRPNLQIHLAGGELRADGLACSGPETEQFFEGFFADIAFLCAGGVHPQAGITDFYPREIAVRRHMLQRSNEQYVLADSSKLGRVALRRVCEVAGVTAIITDADARPEAVDALTARGVKVLIAGEPEEPRQPPIPESPLLDLDGPPQAFAFDGT